MVHYQEKLNSNVQVNLNKSKEISYWAKKMNMNSAQLQKKFEELGSISRTIAYCQQHSQQLGMMR